jgi:hypothetical protein
MTKRIKIDIQKIKETKEKRQGHKPLASQLFFWFSA